MQQRVCKTALTNIIRHTNIHNRLVEESECWRQYNSSNEQKTVKDDGILSRSRDCSSDSSASAYRRRLAPRTCPPESSAVRPVRMSAHMDEADELQQRSYEGREEGKTMDYYWTKQLYNAEQADPDRWGHNGYKELYPQEFNDKDKQQSSTTEDESSSEERKEKKKKKKSRKKKRHRLDIMSGDDSVNKKRKKSKKSKSEDDHAKKERRKKKKTYSDDINEDYKKELSHSKKKRRKKSKICESDESDSEDQCIDKRAKNLDRTRLKRKRQKKISKNISDIRESDDDHKHKRKRHKKD